MLKKYFLISLLFSFSGVLISFDENNDPNIHNQGAAAAAQQEDEQQSSEEEISEVELFLDRLRTKGLDVSYVNASNPQFTADMYALFTIHLGFIGDTVPEVLQVKRDFLEKKFDLYYTYLLNNNAFLFLDQVITEAEKRNGLLNELYDAQEEDEDYDDDQLGQLMNQALKYIFGQE